MRDKSNFLKKRIKKKQQFFLRLERKIAKKSNLNERCALAYKAAIFAVNHVTDIFSSEIIENAFLELAQKEKVSLPEQFYKGTVLHVMTEAYIFGGHTRCVERWITQCPEQTHSCIVLHQIHEFPQLLRNIVEKNNGTVTLLNPDMPMLQKAIKLRQYASSFEYIVLHIHMDDPTALMAFGTTDFKRPIVFFNHADHSFWLGVSIADYVADLSTSGNTTTVKKRGVKNAAILGIPADTTALLIIDKQKARKKLAIPLDKKVIFSSGQAHKYDPIKDPCYYDIVSDLVSIDKNIIFYIAGVDELSTFWPKLKKRFPQNLFLLGYINYKTAYPLYLSACDLVLDSHPVGSSTAMTDAIKAKKPILTLITTYQSDYLVNSEACCQTYQIFLDKAQKILNDTSFAEHIYQNVCQNWQNEADTAIWHQKCENILAKVSKTHQIYSFCRQQVDDDITSLSLEMSQWVEPIKKWNLRKKINIIKNYLKCPKLFKTTFDHVISMGGDSACAMYLNKTYLRDASYPFDWLTNASFDKRIELLTNHFNGFLELQNMVSIPKPSSGDPNCDYYADTNTGFYFYHDFKINFPVEQSFPSVKEKYQRRIKRLYRNIARAKKVLFVWWSRDKKIDKDTLLKAQTKLSNYFGKPIYLLVFENNEDFFIAKREDISNFIVKFTADFMGGLDTVTGDEAKSLAVFRYVYNRMLYKTKRKLAISRIRYELRRIRRFFIHKEPIAEGKFYLKVFNITIPFLRIKKRF